MLISRFAASLMKCEGVERSSAHNRHLPTDKRCDIVIVIGGEILIERPFDGFDHESLVPRCQCFEGSERSDASCRCCTDAEVHAFRQRPLATTAGICSDPSAEV